MRRGALNRVQYYHREYREKEGDSHGYLVQIPAKNSRTIQENNETQCFPIEAIEHKPGEKETKRDSTRSGVWEYYP